MNTTNLTCGCCGKTFDLEKDGGVISKHMQAEEIECRACALETCAYDARFQAAQVLLKPLDLYVTDSEGPFGNQVQDYGDPIPAIVHLPA